jgi:hypothetical protein
MRDIIRQILKEESDDDRLLSHFKKKWDKEKDSGERPTFKHNEFKKLTEAKMLPKNKFAKVWLSQYNDLKKYKSENGRFIYLANNNGSIMVSLDTQLNETAVSYELIWSMLERYFTEKETRRKIIGWLLDQYHLADMGYIYDESQDMMGKIDNTDILIESNQLTESQENNPLKNFFFKRWQNQLNNGLTPSIYDIKKLGLSQKKDEIIQYFVEFMGYDEINSRSEAVKQYLLNHTFTENEITDMKYLDEGKIKIKFTKVEFTESDMYQYGKNLLDLYIDFVVLSGSFYNSYEEVTYNFSSDENPFDDFVSYWEFKDEIKNFVGGFVFTTLESFGYDINRHFNAFEIEWE